MDEAQFEAALEKYVHEVADLTPEEIEARLNQFAQEHGLDGELEDDDEEFAEDELAADDDAAGNDEAADFDDAEEEVTFGSVVGSLFGPIDGLFILLAFFTAYKVGAGKSDD